MSRTLKILLVVAFAMSLATCNGGYIDVEKILVPSTDPGRFDVYVDGVMMPGGANMTNGTHSGATPYSSGTHTVTEQAHPGSSTNLANYTVTFAGACSANGIVNLAANSSVECTITNTNNTVATNPPPAPAFLLPGGMGACPGTAAGASAPYTVSLSDAAPSAKIFFTTDTTTPTQSSTQFTVPIPVNASQTITAIAANAAGTSAPVAQNYLCGAFTSVTLGIQTGDDDARTDSAIQATLAGNSGSTAWCLKPSNNGSFGACTKSPSGVTWGNFSTNSSTPTLSAPTSVNGFNSLMIQLIGFPGFAQSPDNWDLQSLTLVGNVNGATAGFPSTATVLFVSGSTPPGSGTCFARFKHPNGEQVSTVTFSFVNGPVVVMDDNGPHNAPYCPD